MIMELLDREGNLECHSVNAAFDDPIDHTQESILAKKALRRGLVATVCSN